MPKPQRQSYWWLLIPAFVCLAIWGAIEHPPPTPVERDLQSLCERADAVEVRYTTMFDPIEGKHMGVLKQPEAAAVFSHLRLKPWGRTYRIAASPFWKFTFKREGKQLTQLTLVANKDDPRLQSVNENFWPQTAFYINPRFYGRFESELKRALESSAQQK